MPAFMDFFNLYIIVFLQIITGFHFFTKFIGKKVNLFYYLLFAISGTFSITVIQNPGMADFMVYIFLLILSGIFIYRAEVVEVILYAVLTAGILQLCYGIFNSILGILYPFILYFNNNIPGILFILIGNMALPATILCYKVLYKYFSYNETIKSRYVLMVFVPVLMLFLAAGYISAKFYTNANATDGILNTRHLYLLVIQLFGMVSLGCILFTYKKLLENFRLNTELSLLLQEEHLLGQYAEEARINYEKTRSFRHDIKNHITIIKELLQNGKTGQALNYTMDMENMAAEMSFQYNTNNPVLNILLGNKLGMARDIGADVQCFLVLPYPCAVRDIDFCIILSNLLDNAVNACKEAGCTEEKFIYVTGKVQGDFILIEVRNSFNGKAVYKEGTGLSNARAAAARYNGALNISIQDKTFTASVLLAIK